MNRGRAVVKMRSATAYSKNQSRYCLAIRSSNRLTPL